MGREHFKTQILLLHSQQSTLEVLSAGFNEQYSVHLATTGTEALNTLGETPIHVIVTAQDLPGMSGLEALREARKRSPDTIGILLAGTDRDDGLEALVGDQEVFQIIRGAITPPELRELIDEATRRVRLVALSESANDQAANPDEPVAEHIVMETLENGTSIISDGTGRMPALKPGRVPLVPNIGGRQIDVLVLTRDDEFLATVRDSARGLHTVHHANTPTQADKIARGHKVGVLVTDAAMIGANVEILIERLRKAVPRLVAVVAGRRDDGELLMDLINRGHVYRFLLKPVSPGRARLAIEASVKHHLEAADSAFKGRPKSAVKVAPAKPVRAARPKAKAKAKPMARAKPKPTAKAQLKPTAKAQLKPTAQPQPKAKRHPVPTPIVASSKADRLSDPFEQGGGFSETMSGIASFIGKFLSGAFRLIAGGAITVLMFSGKTFGKLLAAATAPLWKPRNLAIVASLVTVIGGGYWLASNWDSLMPESVPEEAARVPTIVESDLPIRPSGPQSIKSPTVPGIENLLDNARIARDFGRIFSPPGSNAVELYLAAMSSAPNNGVVAAEFEQVVNQTLGMTETALLEERMEDAAEALQVVRLADPGNSRLVFLGAQLLQLRFRNTTDQARAAIRSGRFEDAGKLIGNAEALRTRDTTEINVLKQELSTARSAQRVDEVLALASARLNDDKLITPSNDNARYYYELVLSNDPQNPAAEQGITIIASKLALKARTAIDKEQFALAGSLLRDAEALDPTNSDLATSKTALDDTRARQEAERQAAVLRKAEAERLAEAEQQAAAARQEAERQAVVLRKVEAERLAEAERRAASERQATIERQAELERQLTAEREAETRRQAAAEKAAAAAAVVAAAAVATQTQTAQDKPSGVRPEATDQSRTVADADEQAAATIEPPAVQQSGTAEKTLLAVATATADAQFSQASTTAKAAGSPPEPLAINRLKRTNYVAPKYPRSAERRNTSGWVDVSFTVSREGSVHSIEIIESTPGTVFDDSATKAISQWRFEPVVENGVAVERRVAVRMMFTLQ